MPAEENEGQKELLSNQRGPDKTAQDREKLQALDKAIGELPQQLKSPLILTALEGLSQAETGQLLGISPKAVETKVYRGRKFLLEKMDKSGFLEIFCGIRKQAPLEGLMNTQFLKLRTNFILGLLTAFGLGISSPAMWAQEKGGALKAWAAIQQSVKDMETAVQSKNLHAIHEPSMKIRSPIRTLKGHSSMLSGDKGQKVSAALKQLDSSVTDLHSASDEGNQAKAEEALKSVESAFDQLKAEDPDSAFKGM